MSGKQTISISLEERYIKILTLMQKKWGKSISDLVEDALFDWCWDGKWDSKDETVQRFRAILQEAYEDEMKELRTKWEVAC